MAEVTKGLLDPERTLKEVFSSADISVRTELNPMQIEALNKLNTLAVIFGNDLMPLHADDFMKKQKSLGRKSMAEFIEGLKSKKTDMMDRVKNLAMFG